MKSILIYRESMMEACEFIDGWTQWYIEFLSYRTPSWPQHVERVARIFLARNVPPITDHHTLINI